MKMLAVEYQCPECFGGNVMATHSKPGHENDDTWLGISRCANCMAEFVIEIGRNGYGNPIERIAQKTEEGR